MRTSLLLSVACIAIATPAFAQEGTASPQAPASANPQADVGNNDADTAADASDIIVTATRRSEALSDVPLAVSAVTAATLQNSGASDIRQLNQLSPSLLVSSTSSEAAAGGARIRGIGTVGDNPGLESSVATFIDGVYRNRAGVGLTELGHIDRIEVLRGPQGTLFGRNASAGLISVITAKPEFNFGGELEGTYGNYDAIRVVGGVTGPISESVAFRADGVYFKRDGFLRDVVSGRRINNRDRYLARGQLLFQPDDAFSIRLIGDYSNREEECCGATFLPSRNVTLPAGQTPNGPGTPIQSSPNTIVAIERGLGGIIRDDTYSREVSITPGIGYRGDVRDWGVSGEVNYDFGGATLTSITAYRDWRLVRGQDADFNNLSILERPGTDADNQRQTFKTFTQELRIQGTAFDDRLDFLFGGYFANEKLGLRDNLRYGSDFERYGNCVLADNFAASFTPALVSTAGAGCFNAAVVPGVTAALTAAAAANPAQFGGTLAAFRLLTGQTIPGLAGFRAVAAAIGQPALQLNGVRLDDRFNQTSRNYAFFTHNVFQIVPDRLSLTLGLRYTNETKTLDASFVDNNRFCEVLRATPLAGLAAFPCVIPPVPGGTFSQNDAKKKEDEFTGTGVLSFKATDELLTYASYSRGYKAGGFNLDRSGLTAGAPNTQQLTFDPEIVNAVEVGAKYNGRGFDLNIAGFYQRFRGFQLNTFNGINFIVENIYACDASLNGADRDNSSATGACTGKLKSGVISKGVELEAYIRPASTVSVNLGLTYADTEYKNDLVGTGGRPLAAALFQLPGSRLSNSSQYVATAAFTWTPPLGDSGLTGLVYFDGRLQSDTNTGSDKDIEKTQDAFGVLNGRIGIRGPDQRWGVELWAQNLLDEKFQQVSFDAPLQGGNATAGVQRGFYPRTNQLYGVFLGEPRTYGVTARVKF